MDEFCLPSEEHRFLLARDRRKIVCACCLATAAIGLSAILGLPKHGEAEVLGVDCISDFNALHSRKHDHEVQLYAFDILAMGGDDLRSLPLHLRKTNLERLRRPDGITVAPFERDEIGPDLFRAACRMGLEGLVSKHRDRPYRGGRRMFWIKVKNRRHPALIGRAGVLHGQQPELLRWYILPRAYRFYQLAAAPRV